jgi:creatinine amidohydrolase
MGDARPVLLEDLTWPAIADLVAAGEAVCLLPIGATEQHGRHLPIATDTEIATAICRAASARTGVPVLPTLWVSSSQAHTTAWPGTLALPPRLVVEVVVELARWVRASGFTKLLIVNAHAGNVAPLRVAVDEIRHAGEPRVGLLHWFDLTPEIAAVVTADADDWHAHAAETALMLHLRPELVDRGQIRDDPDRTIGLVFSYTVAETSREGLTGSPSQATAEQGADLFERIISALAERVEAARAESPPTLDRG